MCTERLPPNRRVSRVTIGACLTETMIGSSGELRLTRQFVPSSHRLDFLKLTPTSCCYVLLSTPGLIMPSHFT